MDQLFLQYGALGVISTLALTAVRVLFKREIDAHDADVKRAERVEAELMRLNETVRTQYLLTLTQATNAISDALQVVRDARFYYDQESIQKNQSKSRRH